MEQAYVDEHCSQCVYALGQADGYKCLRARRYDCLDVECPIYDSGAMPKAVIPEPVTAVHELEHEPQSVDPEEKPLTRKPELAKFKILPAKEDNHKVKIIKSKETPEPKQVEKPVEPVKPEPEEQKPDRHAGAYPNGDSPSYAQEALENAMKQDEKAADIIHHPAHYTWRGRECVEHLRDWLGHDGYLAYLEGNVQKYLYRWQKKNGIEDLDKAIEYIELMKKEAKV